MRYEVEAGPARTGRRGLRRARRAALGLLLALMLLAGAALASAARASRPGSVTYRLDWRWGRAEPSASGWATANDLGYHIEVERGHLVHHSAALVACPGTETRLRDLWLDRLSTGAGLRPRRALAGHAELPVEPTQVERPLVERLDRPTAIDLGRAEVGAPEWAYCQAHHALGLSAGDRGALEGDPAAALPGLSLAGRWWREGELPRPFAIESDLAWGAMDAIHRPPAGPTRSADADGGATDGASDGALRVRLEGAEIQIVLRRDLGAIFDGVDFGAMDPETQAKALWMGLAEATRFELAEGPARPRGGQP